MTTTEQEPLTGEEATPEQEPMTDEEAAFVEREDEPGKPLGLYAKLAKIMGELSAIPSDKMRHVTVETRSGGSYSYDYITEATLMEELRPKLAREGIAVLYSDKILRSPEPGEDADNLTIVQVTVTFIDGETGEKWNSHSEGYGTDLGDKGANKAKTSALRYLLWKTFLFASDVDPETENVERRSGGGSTSGGGGRPASDKQKGLVRKLIGELGEKGTTFGGDHPDEAIHRRTAVEDLNGPQASRLIDVLMQANKADVGDLDAGPIEDLLGPKREGGDLPDEPNPTDAGPYG